MSVALPTLSVEFTFPRGSLRRLSLSNVVANQFITAPIVPFSRHRRGRHPFLSTVELPIFNPNFPEWHTEADVYERLLQSPNLRKVLRRKAALLFTPRNRFILLTHELVDFPFVLLPNEPERHYLP